MTNAVTFTDFKTMIQAGFEGYLLAQLTDQYLIACWNGQNDLEEEKLLELRVFNQNAEYKLFRSHIGKKFRFRCITDERLDVAKKTATFQLSRNNTDNGSGLYTTDETMDFFDQEQYLDIDTEKTEQERLKADVFATGGGKYSLPVQFVDINEARIRIRYYFDRYENTGQARIADWRLVDFLKKKVEDDADAH